jgi:hypothetical protein
MALHSAVCLDTLDKGNKMATLSDFYLGDPRLNQYYLGSGVGATRFNQNVRPTTRFMSRGRGPESLYLNNMGVFAPTQMGDFNPSAGILGMDMPRLRFDPQIQPSRMPVVVEDRMAQDNPNYRAMAALEPVAAQAEPAAAQAEPAQEAGAAPRRTLGLLGDMFGGASALDEYMTPEQRAQMQNQGVMAAAMQLLASSGPSRVPVGLGQALREAYGAGQKGYTAAQQNLLQSMTMKQKMDEYKRDIADQKAYREYLIGGGQVGAQPAGVVTPEQAINAPGGQVSPTVARAAMIGTEGAAMPVAAAAAPTGLASLTQEQRMILSRLPAKEGYKEALRLMEQKTESVPDDIKKLKALGLPVTLENLLRLNPAAAAQDPEKIRILKALNLPITLANLQSLNPERPEASPTEVRILEATGTPVTLENVMNLRKSGAGGGTTVSVNTGEKGFTNEFKIKDAFSAEPVYKEYQGMKSAFLQIQESLKKANPIGDVAAATKIMKLLDPGSVVRESELGIAMAASGKMDRLTNYVDMYKNGTLLTPSQRNEFNALATELFAASSKAYNDKRNEYAGFGAKYGIDANQALGAAVIVPQPMTPAATPAAGGAPVLTWDPVAKKFK